MFDALGLLNMYNSMVQFFVRLGCGPVVGTSAPLFLQYSVNGGVNWITIEQFDFNGDTNVAKYIAVHMPPHARTNATQVRWWQPSRSGTHTENWAVDQVRKIQDDTRCYREIWIKIPTY